MYNVGVAVKKNHQVLFIQIVYLSSVIFSSKLIKSNNIEALILSYELNLYRMVNV